MSETVHKLPGQLVRVLNECGPLVVAFSGGVDSSFLAVAAHLALGGANVRAVTAVSPSLEDEGRARCSALAAEWGFAWEGVATTEMDDPRYTANGPDRCYWCKTHLMDALLPIAGEATIVLGVNVDDLGDHRPGQAAAREAGARFPLVEAGLTKSDIRTLSKALGLSTWDRPASPCLSSRLPYGTAVTIGRLSEVERAERSLRALGIIEFRVRHHGQLGLVEVAPHEEHVVLANRPAVVAAVRSAGFSFVALDLEGFQSGKLNRSHQSATT